MLRLGPLWGCQWLGLGMRVRLTRGGGGLHVIVGRSFFLLFDVLEGEVGVLTTVGGAVQTADLMDPFQPTAEVYASSSSSTVCGVISPSSGRFNSVILNPGISRLVM